MLMVCQNGSINIASFIRISLKHFNLHITLHQFLSLTVLYITSYTHNYFFPCSTLTYFTMCTWCDRKVMRVATLCTNRQCCCYFPLHMEVRLTPCRRLSSSLNLLQLKRDCWERLKWSYVCEVRYENGPAKVWTKLCHLILCKVWRIRYCDLWKVTKYLWRISPIQCTSVQMAQVLFRRPRTSGRRM